MFRSIVLSKQAKQDYEQARGTAHKRLLRNAKERLEAQVTHHEENMQKLRRELDAISSERDAALKQEVSAHLIRTYLREVPGIGQKRQEAILHSIFRKEIGDLRYASRLDGIGPQLQNELDKWVSHYERRVPVWLEKDFPGKRDVVARYEAKHEELSAQMESERNKRAELRELLKPVYSELRWLDQIESRHFKRALQQTKMSHDLDRYAAGVFGEWEAMPEWFRDALSAAEKSVPVSRSRKQSSTPDWVWLLIILVLTVCVLGALLLLYPNAAAPADIAEVWFAGAMVAVLVRDDRLLATPKLNSVETVAYPPKEPVPFEARASAAVRVTATYTCLASGDRTNV